MATEKTPAPIVTDEEDTEETEDTQPVAVAVKNPATFDEWLTAVEIDDTQRSLGQKLVAGLKTALDSERVSRKALERQVKSASASAEQGSALQLQLDELANELTGTNMRATFYEGAIQEGVKPKSARLAFIAAQTDELIDADGAVAWSDLREIYPELFDTDRPALPAAKSAPDAPITPRARTSAGAGTGAPAPRRFDMNNVIRGAAGRRG